MALPELLHSWSGLSVFAQAQLKPSGAFTGPAILAAILAIHCAYFRLNRKSVGQQAIALQDLSSLGHSASDPSSELTVVRGDCEEFDARTRTSRKTFLPLPAVGTQSRRNGGQRLPGAQRFCNTIVRQTLICGDDVATSGDVIFCNPLKVSGDLLVEGHAIFLGPVIVNGILKIEGRGHFAAGIILKGDAMVRGAIAIGSDDCPAWAVVREMALRDRLQLHGTLVADRAVELREAA